MPACFRSFSLIRRSSSFAERAVSSSAVAFAMRQTEPRKTGGSDRVVDSFALTQSAMSALHPCLPISEERWTGKLLNHVKDRIHDMKEHEILRNATPKIANNTLARAAGS